MTKTGKGYLPIIVSFVVLSLLIFFIKDTLIRNGFDILVLYIANLLLFFITFSGYLLQQNSLRSSNPQAFIRSVYGSMMLKLFICMIAVFAYAFVFKSRINKPSLFTAMGMYIIYAVIEVTALTKVLRKNRNA